jgi:hypothetical protein
MNGLNMKPIECDPTGDSEFDSAEWTPIPFHLREGLHEYIRVGRPTGDFLKAFLSNDLFGALIRADHQSAQGLKETAMFLTWHCPALSYGSEAKYNAWIKRGGIIGVPSGTTAIMIDPLSRHLKATT